MARRVVVVTRVGCRFGRNPIPDVDRVLWWARLAAQAHNPHPRVWVTHESHLGTVRQLAPADVHVVGQDATEVPEIDGERFTVVRQDADDFWAPGALDGLEDLPPDTLVQWPNGWQLDLERGDGWALSYDGRWTPPYIAVTQESRADMLNFAGQHTQAHKGRTVQTRIAPSWLQTVGWWNTDNRADRFNAGNRWPPKLILQDLDMTPEQFISGGRLDLLAARYGTDKGTAPARGLFPKRFTVEFYEPELEPIREQPIRLLELGVQAGSSVRMWLDYLPNAKVAGLDVKPAPNSLTREPRYRHFKGQQDDEALLKSAVAWLGGLDAWIDDASHRHADHVASYAILWPLLEPGGWAAIEDLHAAPASVDWLEGLGATFYASNRLAVLRKPAE